MLPNRQADNSGCLVLPYLHLSLCSDAKEQGVLTVGKVLQLTLSATLLSNMQTLRI